MTKYKLFLINLVAVLTLTVALLSATQSIAHAFPNNCDQATCLITCNDGTISPPYTRNTQIVGPDAYPNTFCSSHGGVKSLDNVPGASDNGLPVTTASCTGDGMGCLFSTYINPLVNFLIALTGVAVVISIIIGGIQYSSSGGDPQKASAAKNRIRNSLVALVAFIFLFALLNFLVPGGIG